MKKPLNAIEVPTFPDIKKGPPRFQWSRKFWQADPGATLRDTEPFTQFYENAILVQSRDYNKTQYGQSSHKDNVNSEFRPPILSPYEDLGPITRIPCTIHAIVPHINPGTAGHDGGTSSYASKNQRPSDIEGHLTDRLKDAGWRPTFYAPMDAPIDNSVLPDLEVTMPYISVQSGWNIPYNSGLSGVEGVHQPIPLREQIFSPPLMTGKTTSLQVDAPNMNREGFELIDNLPNYSTDARMNTPFEQTNFDENVTLRYTGPNVSGTSGLKTQMRLDGHVEHNYNFKDNIPKYSMTMGATTPFNSGLTKDSFTNISPNPELEYNRPQYSTTAGATIPYTNDSFDSSNVKNLEFERMYVPMNAGIQSSVMFNAETPELHLQSRLDSVPINVLNPGSDVGYSNYSTNIQSLEGTIKENIPSYSYQVPSEVPTYRTKNESTHSKHFVEKLQIPKSYGEVSQSGGYIPRFGLDMPRQGFGGSGKIVSKMGYNKPKVMYKI